MKPSLAKFVSFKDFIIAILILIVSIGYYFDAHIPEGLDEVNWFNIKIKSYHYEDIATMIYITKMKVYIIVLSVIWYLSSKLWWKSSILVIITIELLKLISAFNPNQQYMDEIEYLSSLPITIPIVLLLIFTSNKINQYNLAKQVRCEIDQEIDDLFFELHSKEKTSVNYLKLNFNKLKSKKHSLDKEEYLKSLIAIRNSFYES